MLSMYERLGRTEGIRSLVNTIAGAHLSNPIIAKRFEPLAQDPAKLEASLSQLANFLENASGGPAQYTGKSMIDAHKGMNISGEEYLAAMDDIMGALVKHGIDENTQKDALTMLYTLKPTVVRL